MADAPSDDPLNDTVRPYNAAVQELLEQLAEEACIGLFDAYGLRLTRVEHNQIEEVSLTGVIGFTGPGMWGMCLLAADKEPLRASNPTPGSLRDWMAELSNQLAGRLKHKLIARGSIVYITTPIVLRGARIEPLPRRHLTPRWFKGGGGSLSLWVEVETAPDFKLDKNAFDEDAANEGDALLF
jgi:hypothetical protein